jgi:cell volume regulation protein A
VSIAAAALEEHLLLGGVILALAAGAALASRWLRLPALITFLALGMLLGSEGIGAVSLHDPDLARTIGTLGLIAILFEGGLATKWADVRPVLAPTCLLGTIGVVITATVIGLAALVLFDLSTVDAFLLGAVVSSTDAAAVFAALRVTRLRRRVATLLSAESGVNDPMAVALTLGFISWAVEPDYGAADITLLLVRELGLGLVVGVVFGYLVTRLAPRMPQDLAAFAPIASVATAALAYGLADRVGGSGFLSVYIVALALGNTPMPLQPVIVAFHEGLAFIAEAVLFIVLGLLVFPSSLGPVALSALALAGILVFGARPLAVVSCTIGHGFEKGERAFLAWAGLRGAVPIVLATFVLSEQLEASNTIFNAVFFVVIVSALVHGLTLGPLARRLRLADETTRPSARLAG